MFKKILKHGALFFAVGVALALVAPPLATALGSAVLGEAAVAHAVATPVMWTGVFFGAFGALNTALAPVFDTIFGDKPQGGEKACAHEAHKDRPAPSCGMDMGKDMAGPSQTKSHCEALAARRESETAQPVRG